MQTFSRGIVREYIQCAQRKESRQQNVTEANHPFFLTFPNTAKVRAQLTESRQSGEAEIAEKEEMGRLYNALLRQLQAAEEEKEELQVKFTRPSGFKSGERLMRITV